MRAVFMGILGFLIGLAVTVFAVFFGYILFTIVTGYHDFEGATAMGLATAAPLIGLVGGVAGAALFVQLARRRV